MSLIKGLGGASTRTNPFRAFGDGVYLSGYWSHEAPSRHEIGALLSGFKKLGLYQLNYEGGVIAEDGSIKFPTNAEPFTWEAEAWCAREKHPIKLMGWLRNTRDGRTVSLAQPGILRNTLYCLNFFCMFRGLLLDMDFETMEEQKAFMELLRSARETYRDMSIMVRGRNLWLNRPAMVAEILDLVSDLEIPLYDTSIQGEAFRLWCVEETRRAVQVVGARQLMLSVPAFHAETSRHGPGETLERALGGVRTALSDLSPARLRLSVYREGHATEDDWDVFAREWAH